MSQANVVNAIKEFLDSYFEKEELIADIIECRNDVRQTKNDLMVYHHHHSKGSIDERLLKEIDNVQDPSIYINYIDRINQLQSQKEQLLSIIHNNMEEIETFRDDIKQKQRTEKIDQLIKFYFSHN
ncbi:hypothetical protein SNEBB_005003 [Seison nebaliae]|nr:hypothetical protein SNEBB_005003 [Seison nebaliae]